MIKSFNFYQQKNQNFLTKILFEEKNCRVIQPSLRNYSEKSIHIYIQTHIGVYMYKHTVHTVI
jgi:hypothetical protein